MIKGFLFALVALFGGHLFAGDHRTCASAIRQIEARVLKAARYYNDVYLGVEVQTPMFFSFKRIESFSAEPVIEVVSNKSGIKTRSFIIFKNRLDGIRSLLAVTKTSDTELGWVYLPELEMWINVATSVDDTSARLDRDLIKYLPLAFSRLDFIHIHPLSAQTGLEREYLIVPSYLDLVAAMALNSVVDRAKHNFGIYTSSIVSPFGLTTIHQNPEMIDQNYESTYRVNSNRRMNGRLQNAIRVLSDAEKRSEVRINGDARLLRPFRLEFISAEKLK
jgi:hypothetical protein